MKRLLLCLMLGLCAQAVQAQTPPPASNFAGNSIDSERVRQLVLERWQLPHLAGDAIASVRATVLPDHSLAVLGLDIRSARTVEREQVRSSLLAAIAGVSAPVAPGPVAFSLTARSGGAYLAGCFPLKVYVEPRLGDSAEALPSSSIEAIQQGARRWNRLITGFGDGGAAVTPFVLVTGPEAADVHIQGYRDYPDYASYLVNDAETQAVVRLPLKQKREAMFQSGEVWRHPEVVTQETMFQLGRLLGLDPSEVPDNVLYPNASNTIFARSTSGTIEQLKGVVLFGQGPSLAEAGRTDRTIESEQLRTVAYSLRNRSCGQKPATALK
ncbi:hypothetical protein [Gloeobacter kilaueensis]|uniref:Uncharacterized protein n=1 Tax=Gloeobacter kilaueensis (strain ATCC BAA-2537 / CCAP 1431/1 / ULC 316 / JS1) TaxID=1183438 RepID=U5QH00_GLOK1|nr:hypothetical protein [Gloeobacter kilaueensis]AGY58252.1 hypothetical protein GKIL_2006 [Gloeobacter kilaueensis JS1]